MKEYTFFLTFYSPYGRNLPPTVKVPTGPENHNIDKIFTILEFLSNEYDVLRIVGGEPFSVPFFNEVIDFAVKHYKKIIIETYGTGDVFRYSYNIRQHISSGADIEILIQMADLDSAINDKIMGYKAWENAISYATLLDSLFEIRPKFVLYVGSHSTHKYGLLKSLGYDVIVRRAYGLKISKRVMEVMFKLPEHDIEVEDCIYNSINKGVNCKDPHLVIDYDGNIYVFRWNASKDTVIANIFGMTMDDLNNVLEKAYSVFNNVTLHGKCSVCAYKEICRGGDPLFWQSFEKAYDPLCPIEEPVEGKLVEAEPVKEEKEIPQEFTTFEIDEEPTVDESQPEPQSDLDIESLEEEVLEDEQPE